MASGKAAAASPPAAAAPAGKAAAAAKAPPAAASWPEAAAYAAFLLYLIVTLGPPLARNIADICAEQGCGGGLQLSPWIDGKVRPATLLHPAPSSPANQSCRCPSVGRSR